MNQNFLHKDREAIQMPICLYRKWLKHYLTNDNHAIPSAMSGFITEILTLAVYSNFVFIARTLPYSGLFSRGVNFPEFP